MTDIKYRILILDQGRQALPLLKSLHKAGHYVVSVANTKLSESYFSRYPDKKLIWPSSISDPHSYYNKLISFLVNNDIDITIGVSDFSAEILSKNKDEIEKFTQILIPEYSIFSKVVNKLTLMEYCMQNDIPCPLTFNINTSNITEIAKTIKYPVILKPIRGVGALGIVKCETSNQLLEKYSKIKQKYGDLLVQEFIPQENGLQYQAEAFLNKDCELTACVIIDKPRYFPVNGGTSSVNSTVKDEAIYSSTKKLLEGLKWVGAADVDYILDPRDGIAKVLEINPRVTAGIKIAFAAGVDFSDLYLKTIQNIPYSANKDYKVGVYCRNLFLETMWWLYSSKEMKQRNQVPFFTLYGRNVVEQTFSIDDPLPMLGFLLNMLKKYTNLNHLKEKTGKNN